MLTVRHVLKKCRRAKLQLVSLHNRRLFIKPQYVYKIINNINCPKRAVDRLFNETITKTLSILQWSNIIRSTIRLRLNVNRRRLSSRLRVPGILKAVVSFYRIDTETAFERQRSYIPINSVTPYWRWKIALFRSLVWRSCPVNMALEILMWNFITWLRNQEGRATILP